MKLKEMTSNYAGLLESGWPSVWHPLGKLPPLYMPSPLYKEGGL